jgi:hypothetical protein
MADQPQTCLWAGNFLSSEAILLQNLWQISLWQALGQVISKAEDNSAYDLTASPYNGAEDSFLYFQGN